MSLTERVITPTNVAYTVDQMTEHDLLEVVEIEETSGLSRWGWAAYYSELQGAHSRLMKVARVDNRRRGDRQVAGYIVARIAADELHINNVAVRSEYRGQGIGYDLVSRILEAGRQANINCAFLELRAGNTAALGLYEKCGFQVTSRRTRYYSDPVEDALVMITQFKTNP